MSQSNPQLQGQFCPDCGTYFIRLRTKAAKALKCGDCIHAHTINLPNLTTAGREYAENGLYMWRVHQEALRAIPGAPTEETQRRAARERIGDVGELPF